jgi:hypothetical protein
LRTTIIAKQLFCYDGSSGTKISVLLLELDFLNLVRCQPV